jgi:hypothetical protein
MPNISLTARELHERRPAIIRLLAPLVADRGRIEIRRIGAGLTYTLGVLNKGQSPNLITDADLIRVPTLVRGVFLNYYEVWVSDRDSGEYVLDRAYMHVHLKKADEAPDRQILCLHCDPRLSTQHQSFAYRRGPHLHVLGASPNIDRSHISVCLTDPQHGGADVHVLTQTLQLAVKMIEREIFPHYRAA